MIIAVSGVSYIKNNENYQQERQKEYIKEFYQPTTKNNLRMQVDEDFGKVLDKKLLQINILI